MLTGFVAGSGKTRTLTSRVAHLLGEPQCLAPQNVIVATFTVKAAREMKERIAKLVGDGTEAKLVLGTFHSIARRYLLRYGHLVGIRVGWGIADTGDSLGIVKVCAGTSEVEGEEDEEYGRRIIGCNGLRLVIDC